MPFDKFCAGLIISVILYLVQSSLSTTDILDDYFKQRKALIRKSEENSIGGNITLDGDESSANEILMKYKSKELQDGLTNSDTFAGDLHFFKAKPYMEMSKVFKIIKKMPKGASLHSHDMALVCDEYVFYNITYRDNLYAKNNSAGYIDLQFFKSDPEYPWMPISQWRELDGNFNSRLKKQLTMFVKNPEVVYPDGDTAWNRFQNIFSIIQPLLTYRAVYRDYFYQALEELYEDNIRYLEFRSILPQLYDLDGRTYGPEDVVQLYYETSRDFMKSHPDFWGVKLIFAPSRYTTADNVESYVQFVQKMEDKFPRFLAGFDLVGREDSGPTLIEFIPQLLQLKSITKLFFHAGETLWSGEPPDLNLFDAILLNATRIGHGYAALKHPEILKAIREKSIALEISPISNQVLGLVKDIRNHPANFLIANNYPVVITQDDPGFWGAKGVSYDWYFAFMAMSSRQSDLRLLKQLAVNSIIYSSMDEEMKIKTLAQWQREWTDFVESVINRDFW